MLATRVSNSLDQADGPSTQVCSHLSCVNTAATAATLPLQPGQKYGIGRSDGQPRVGATVARSSCQRVEADEELKLLGVINAAKNVLRHALNLIACISLLNREPISFGEKSGHMKRPNVDVLCGCCPSHGVPIATCVVRHD